MKKILIPTIMTLLAQQSYAVASCNPGYSEASLSAVRNSHVDIEQSEVRGDALYYLLQIEISSEASKEARSADNTINISATLKESAENEQRLTNITHLIQSGKASSLCLKADPSSYYGHASLARQFTLQYKQLPGIYVLDTAQPTP